VLEITLDLENQKFKHQKEINNNGIYTLGQSGTKPKILVQGNGTDMSDIQALRGRAKRKLITNKVVLALIDLANKKGDQIRLGSFWNTYHCQNKLISSEDRLYGVYCKNRFKFTISILSKLTLQACYKKFICKLYANKKKSHEYKFITL